MLWFADRIKKSSFLSLSLRASKSYSTFVDHDPKGG